MTNGHSRRDITIEGVAIPSSALPHPDVHTVTSGYTAALGIRLLHGRVFTDADAEGAPRVGLINRSIADRFFAGTDPIGRRFTFGRTGPTDVPTWITIVGVVDDTRLYGLDNPARLEVYVSLRQSVRDEETLVVRSAGDPSALVPGIRALVASLDRDQPLSEIATMEALLSASVSTRQVTFVLLALFSTLALTLAGIGIYGVMSYAVAERTNELGIRLALGAQRPDLLKSVVGQGIGIAGAGIAIGVLVALGLTRLMSNLLFGVSAVDPVTFAAVGAGVALIALVACAIPGWRVLRVNPLIALRRE
jgi:putative ABC transport system permease protein